MIQCPHEAAFRYTWPGNDEALICSMHARRASKIAEAMGFHLQMIPLTKEALLAGEKCHQKIEGGHDEQD